MMITSREHSLRGSYELLHWALNSQTWMIITPRPSPSRYTFDGWGEPPGEVRFGETMPDDVQLCVDGHAITLGDLRAILRGEVMP